MSAWNLKPFTPSDYHGFDAHFFKNGDAPLIGRTGTHILVISDGWLELHSETLESFNDDTCVFQIEHNMESAEEAINTLVLLAECLLGAGCPQHGTHLYQEHDSPICYACGEPIETTTTD